VLTGTVRNITNFGVFVEIEPGIDGLVHISDLSWTKKVRHPGDMVEKDQDLDVVILNIDEERRRISLGHKQVKTNPWDQFADAYEEGTDTKGEVVRVEDKGLVVQLPLDVEAFVPGSELKDGPRNFENFYHEGDELELRVIRFDKSRKDIVLSQTALEEDIDAEEKEVEEETQTRDETPQREERSREPSPTADQGDETTGPTTLGELSGLADLRREMEEEESSDRAEAAEQAAQEAMESDEDSAEEEAADEADEAPEAEADSDAESDAEAEEDEEEAFDEASGFPENFPRVSRLENAGVHSIADLREVDDLTELDGIGASYAEDIEEGLKEFDETGKVSS
jgi:small subunit ribosomal protein S1